MSDEHLISLQPGTVLGGKYEVVKCLGSGSMGLVYACRHRELQGQMVAVKVLFPDVARDRVAAARFRNEVLASYNVSHPHVVRAYDYLRDGDVVAYTMEFVGGGDLAEKLGRQERLPIQEIIKLLSQMSAGVQAIHDAGIVHRDLKPENILLTKDGNVKIGDFGIARTEHGHKLTEHGGVVGTIDYVAPEYMLRSQVDWRSDIYAIGILAYEMVTGEPPFRGDGVYATMTKRLKTDPEPPSKLRPECPDGLDRIILKAMQREPQQRYQSALGIFFDLQKLASELGMPSAFGGGVFLPNQSGGSGAAYVGPTLQSAPGSENGLSAVGSDELIKSGRSQSLTPGVQGALTGVASRVSSQERVRGGSRLQSLPRSDSLTSPSPQASSSDSSTHVLHDNLVDHAVDSAARPSHPELKLESVLKPRQDLTAGQWPKDSESPLTGGVITDRVRDLSHRYHQNRSKWASYGDATALLVAAVIGVAFGFIMLKLFWPSILSDVQF